MMKKILAGVLAGAMVLSLAACGGTSSSTTTAAGADTTAADAETTAAASTDSASTITLWVPDATVDFTKTTAEQFLADNGYDYAVNVEAVGEGDAASNMITDVQGGADIYNFAQDQLARLVSAGALTALSGDYESNAKNNNDAGSVTAASVGGSVYAFPLTSDNGYFLYYDKSVVTDPSSLEQIIADCEAADRSFYMEINSGWYQTAFFFATGAELTYETDDSGNFTACNCTYDSAEGLAALKAIIALESSSAFVNGSSVDNADSAKIAAIVDGTWDSESAKAAFGDNYACAKLPTFTVDGTTYQMSGFGGFKLLGVKPQEDSAKLEACMALADYLTSADVQLARYKEVGWGPSNTTAQADEAVQSDEALSALAEQLAYTIPQGQYPNDYWTLGTSLGDDIIAGTISASTSDDELNAVLTKFAETCRSYVTQ